MTWSHQHCRTLSKQLSLIASFHRLWHFWCPEYWSTVTYSQNQVLYSALFFIISLPENTFPNQWHWEASVPPQVSYYSCSDESPWSIDKPLILLLLLTSKLSKSVTVCFKISIYLKKNLSHKQRKKWNVKWKIALFLCSFHSWDCWEAWSVDHWDLCSFLPGTHFSCVQRTVINTDPTLLSSFLEKSGQISSL